MENAWVIVPVLVVVVGIAILSWSWRGGRADDLVTGWAEKNGYRVVDCSYCWFWKGPFVLTTSKSQMVYYVTFEDAGGRRRRAYVRCGGWFMGMMSDNVEVAWVD
ncbi:MAG TPA: hypothetical protein VFW33_01295 [Gemmataceae bacterium]|nr:hypothetical protein [Gemmataceae bacterium]